MDEKRTFKNTENLGKWANILIWSGQTNQQDEKRTTFKIHGNEQTNKWDEKQTTF